MQNLHRFLLIACLMLVSTTAWACDCERPSLIDLAENATHIFVGRKIPGEGITMEVSEVFKGKVARQQKIYQDPGCAMYFEAGRTHLVFAWQRESDGRIYTNECASVYNIGNEEEIIRKLRKLGPYIDSLSTISPELLYGQLWLDEKAERIDTPAKPRISAYSRVHPVIFFSSKDDYFFNLENPHVFVSLKVDACGMVSEDNSSINYEPDRTPCYERALQWAYSIPWEPATVGGFPVASRQYFALSCCAFEMEMSR